MKHLGIVPILLLLGVGFPSGPAMAELTASQQVPSPVAVGETVMVTVMLTYNGVNSTEAVVTPSLPAGVVSDAGSQAAELYPGALEPIGYPIRAEQSGTYWIVSQIAYAEDGSWHNLQLEAPFTAIGSAAPEPQPQPMAPQASFGESPGGMPPGEMPPDESVPGGIEPGENPPGERVLGGAMPEEVPPSGGSPGEAIPGNASSGTDYLS